ncbi:DUF4335 domain-containing protein [Geitlerinema sp. PCC 9228]|uniref:DUF4335 domain-containing protein n=1 Tax=Geitlerinema sp. PCC 9228 TaxID=111611 RepID=UPI0008F9A9A5|nr:DUF4335 domain-containing protein [Geitlerinema sp. PCC 9228]
MSNQLWRSYHLPTCTLELCHKLPRWPAGNRDLAKRRFRLLWHGEEETEASHQSLGEIAGNYQQLEALREATNTYIQDLLESTPETYNATLLAGVATATAFQPTTTATPEPPESASATTTSGSAATLVQSSPWEKTIYFQSMAGLCHQLHLGPLATETTGDSMVLTTLQLFDLVAACDRYASDKQQRHQIPIHPTKLKNIPQWAQMAALLVVTAGVTATVMETLERRSQPSPEMASTPEETTASPETTVSPSPTARLPSNIEEVPLPPDQELSSRQQQTSPETAASPSPSPSPSPNNEAATGDTSTPPPPPPGATSTPPPPKTGDDLPATDVRTTPISPLPSNDTATRSTQPTPTPTATPSPMTTPTPGEETAADRNSPTALAPPPNASENTAEETANLPQVREAQEYFQSQWQGNPDLEETLQYSLLLDPDGTVKYMRPLSNISGQYIDRTGMPLMGESLVSPLPSGQQMRIRVVLQPSGEVKVFSE